MVLFILHMWYSVKHEVGAQWMYTEQTFITAKYLVYHEENAKKK